MNDYSIPNTEMNRSLASTIAARVGAEARAVAATAAFWRLLGLGGLCLLAGLGTGGAFFGYAYATDQRAAMDRLSSSIADALSKVTLKAEGTVKLDPAGATVRLDASNSSVRLDTSNSTVRLDGSGVSSLVRPTPQQLQGDNVPPSNVKPVTNYTVFKYVAFGKGAVITGWDFKSNADPAPSRQFCYYSENSDTDINASIRYEIGMNYSMMPSKRDVPFDVAQAFQSCVWFR